MISPPDADSGLPDPLVEELARLLDEPDAAFWSGVERLCAAHPGLAARIRAEAAAMHAAAHPEAERTDVAGRAEPRPGERIGPYAVLDVIGHGGMGSVYLAEQRQPVRRRVALKVIKLGMDTRAVLARFEAERQALALMDHPHIAKVLEAGATESGRPYFAMEFVKGIPITRYCDDHKLSLDERLALFRQVCSGVQHAHTKGVIHRDLTPSNVLVALQDGRPSAKIIDFGLARATDHKLTEKTVFTQQGVILGTPAYMSPEQAGLDALDVDMRSDVYALGVLLYELLTGKLPFEPSELRRAGYDGMCRTIREQDPPKPSTKITTVQGGPAAAARLRRTSPDALLRRLRGDLDWIVLKCLEKDRTRRYETVAALSDDVRRHLDHEPVQARAPSLGYRAVKLVQRYRIQTAAAAMVLLSVVGALVGVTWFWREAVAQAEEARRQEGIAATRAVEAETARAGEAAQAADALARKREFDQLAVRLRYDLAVAEEETLHPPWPARAPAMEAWLETADELLAERPAIEATVAELRRRALPPRDADLEHDRATHPRYAAWQRSAARLRALEHAAAVRAGAALDEPAPTPEELAMAPLTLNELAWPRVDPEESKRTWGDEAHALVLAKLAWQKAAELRLPAEDRAWYGDTLAWAWFANGKDVEAVAQSRAALEVAPAALKPHYERLLTRLQAQVRRAGSDAAMRELDELRASVAALTTEVGVQRTYRFAEDSHRFLHDTLADLLAKLTLLEHEGRPAVAERLGWARRITALTRQHPQARVTWQAAREAIAKADGVVASELYRGQAIELRDEQVIGLVPIGMNPATKLWEFYDLRSAWDGGSDPAAIPIPRHVTDGERRGHIDVAADTGIVFVLLPGGRLTMGAQNRDPTEPNFDPHARPIEPPNQVTLAPFFLARHELTQAQWRRLTGGETPSLYHPGFVWGPQPGQVGQRFSWTNPVENVTWTECDRCLKRHGMVLPTEAQWEYGCRGGTTTPWWTGSDRDRLIGAANLADQTLRRGGGGTSGAADWPELDDGFIVHGPVDALRPNPFGLHHVHGNVWEWCADWWGWYALPARPGDGMREAAAGFAARTFRGGGFESLAQQARSAHRSRCVPSQGSETLGLRPARALRP